MELPEDFYIGSTKQEIVEAFNDQSLANRIKIINMYSHLIETEEDEKGKYYLRSMGNNMFAKQYLKDEFANPHGYTKNVIFYYIKDPKEKNQDKKINDLLNGL